MHISKSEIPPADMMMMEILYFDISAEHLYFETITQATTIVMWETRISFPAKPRSVYKMNS